ncbi:hypothetical protein D3C86_1599170 [compost metagenome]
MNRANLHVFRIGNFVRSFHGRIRRIDNIDYKGINNRYLAGGMWQGEKHLKSIKIFKERLLRLGFSNLKYNRIGDYDLTAPDDRIQIFFEINENHFIVHFEGVPECRVDSIHELQNLYFALTGEELKI